MHMHYFHAISQGRKRMRRGHRSAKEKCSVSTFEKPWLIFSKVVFENRKAKTLNRTPCRHPQIWREAKKKKLAANSPIGSIRQQASLFAMSPYAVVR